MDTTSAWLLSHRRNVHSQSGEDGVIEEVLNRLPRLDRWCVEFGARNGVHFSNTRNLIDSKAYSAVLIEADLKRFRDLARNAKGNPCIIPIHRTVGFGVSDGLDQILSGTPVPIDFDLLSVDVDGNDYHIWSAIKVYQPKVVIIEFNPTVPTPVHFVQPPDHAVNQGASLRSMTELASAKGYELVCVLDFNAIYVRSEFFAAYGIPKNSPDAMRASDELVTYLFSGYDGRVFLRGNLTSPWHGVRLSESQAQPLPLFLRHYPPRYTWAQKIGFAIFLLMRDQRRFWRELWRVAVGKR